jgi:hypothetical protein
MLWMVGCSEPADPTLLATMPEPPGANCASGGTAIATGADDNGNGVLDPSEVTSTQYVCSGVAHSLISVVPEPAGANCPAGGQAIEVGIDLNNNNVLDADEVQSTTYLCDPEQPTTIDGTVIVRNSLDAAQLVGVQTITGELQIAAPGLTSIDLSALQTVGGALNIYEYSGATLAFPSLVSVDSLRVVGNGEPALTTLSFPSLLATSELHVDTLPVATLALPSLATVNNLIELSSPAVTSLSFPQLASVPEIRIHHIGIPSLDFGTAFPSLASLDWLEVSYTDVVTSFRLGATQVQKRMLLEYNDVLTTVDLGSLTSVDELIVYDNPALTSIDLTDLTAIRSEVYFRADDALTTLAFPALTSACTATSYDEIDISLNPQLRSITAPNWSTFGSGGVHPYFRINTDPQLPTCMAQALAAQVGATTNVDISGDDTTATCP